MSAITAQNISLSYDNRTIIHDLSLTINKGKITTIIGPNGSGKSTLLRSFSRNLKPKRGDILLDGRNLYRIKPNEVARRVALLIQKPVAPGDLTVRDLVQYGRFPHRSWLNSRPDEDKEIIDWALEETSMTHLENRKLSDLSGGEGQRAWLAMALCQRPQLLILDEPTTFLDIRHQLELMELVQRVNQTFEITVLMVLHDLNQAIRYSDELIVLKNGTIYNNGIPEEVITKEMMRDVFGVEARIQTDELTGKPVFEPIGLFTLT